MLVFVNITSNVTWFSVCVELVHLVTATSWTSQVESFLATQTGERIVALVKEGVYTLSAGTVKCHDDAKVSCSFGLDRAQRGVFRCDDETCCVEKCWGMSVERGSALSFRRLRKSWAFGSNLLVVT